MNRLLISLEQLDSDFPLALKTLYNGKSAGKYHWLTTTRPDGQPGRRLFIVVEEFNAWAQLRGMRFRLQRPTSLASEASFHGGRQR